MSSLHVFHKKCTNELFVLFLFIGSFIDLGFTVAAKEKNTKQKARFSSDDI